MYVFEVEGSVHLYTHFRPSYFSMIYGVKIVTPDKKSDEYFILAVVLNASPIYSTFGYIVVISFDFL